ncbi:MAG: YlbF family regulator [Eubacterium sp.]|nr:YlbF family regulator [Eubacterium sp.]MCR5291499.1 YlbF family regulator [Eubacterium sp.]
MSDIIDECRKLNQMLKDSEEYRKYVQARKNLRANKDLYKSLKELKRINADIHNYSGDNRFDDLSKMLIDYDDLLHNSVVSDFLRAESRLSGLIREMYSVTARDIFFEVVNEDD